MPFAIAGMTFAAVTLLAWLAFRPRENVVARRINPIWTHSATQERRAGGSTGSRLIGPLFRRAGRLIAGLLPQNVVQSTDRLLVMADRPMSLPAFLACWGVSASLGAILLVYVVTALSGITAVLAVGVGLLVVGLFGLGPYVALRRRVRRRQRTIVRALSHTLDLVVTCVEAGLGVDAAFAAVAARTDGPIAQVFSHYLREVGLGRPRRDALAAAAERTGVQDLIRISASVAQAEDMGSTLGDVLRIQADELRLVRLQRAQEAAQRAPVWMTLPLVLCFLPAMAAVIIVPSVLSFLQLLGALGLGPSP